MHLMYYTFGRFDALHQSFLVIYVIRGESTLSSRTDGQYRFGLNTPGF